MINAIINRRLRGYFTVIEPRETGIELDSLLATDYGLVQARESRQPVIHALHRMLQHLNGEELPAVPGLDPGATKHLHSLVLYGPPGTGKTTLAEALAKSGCVPMFLVTPSDIVLSGTELLERRARVVMKALTLITDAVIFFDEFDELLRRRVERGQDGEKGHRPKAGPRSVFEFITPGMLTKFRDLYRRSKEQRTCYLLATNMVHMLEEAAMRGGRFDARIGVYPPDLLSRAGILGHALSCPPVSELRRSGSNEGVSARAAEVVLRTAFGPVGALAGNQWFGSAHLGHSAELSQQGTMINFLLGKGRDVVEEWPEQEFGQEWFDDTRYLVGHTRDSETEAKELKLLQEWETALRSRAGEKRHTWKTVGEVLSEFFQSMEIESALEKGARGRRKRIGPKTVRKQGSKRRPGTRK